MSSRAKLILLAAGVVLLAVLVSALTRGRGPGVSSTARSTYNTDARGCKAFFEVLEHVEEDGPVRLQRLYELEGMRGVLVVVGPLRKPMDRREARLIESWVRTGNGLLYFIGAEEHDRAFCALERDLSSRYSEQDWEMVQYASEETAVLRGVFPSFRAAGKLRYKAPLERVAPLRPAGVPIYYGPRGVFAAWSTLGKGQVMVCATSGPIQNRFVNRDQNQNFLLCTLKVLRPQGGRVIFDELHQGFAREAALADLFSLPGVIAAACQLLICGLLYVWMAGRRMGPPVDLPSGRRLSVGNYLDAAGLLYRERCAPREVVAAYGAFVVRTLARKFGLGRSADPTRLAPLLAQRTSMQREEIEAVLAAAVETQGRLSASEAVVLIRKMDELLHRV